MVFRSLVKHIKPLKNEKAHTIATVKEFTASIARERARSDRNGHGFSVAVFQLGGNVAASDVKLISKYLATEIRVSDEYGWYNHDAIGVLLYNTPSEGAWGFVDNMRVVIDELKIPHSCSVFTYPDEWKDEHTSHRNTDSNSENKSAGASQRKLAAFKNGKSLAQVTAVNLPVWKRSLDIIGALFGIVLFTPIMLVTAVIVKLTSKGPVIFSQKRMGQGGKPFNFYKFRSMVVDAEAKLAELKKQNNEYGDGPAFKLKDDPRITKIGKIIRKTSIDELPQFFNVLRGDMSLVGPRPLILSENQEIDKWHKMRSDVKPGLTCIWQVYGRHLRDYDERMRMDLKYVHNYSLLMDLKLITLTMPAIISQRGAV